MIWTAADRYDFTPHLLFYDEDEEPDLYKNTLEGLAYLCMDEEVLIPFLRGVECGFDPEKYLDMVLLPIGEAIYLRTISERPSLAALREDFARLRKEELGLPRRYKVMGSARQELLRCYEILEPEKRESWEGQFTRQELAIQQEFHALSRLPDAELVKGIKGILLKHYFYKFIPARKTEKAHFLGAGLFVLLAGSSLGDSPSGGGNGGFSEEDGKRRSPVRTFLKHAAGQTTPQEDLQFIRKTFGKPIISEAWQNSMEDRICKGLHEKCRLWYAGPFSGNEEFDQEQRLQYEKNIAFYKKDERFYERSIDRIAEHLKHAIEEQLEPDVVHRKQGILDANRVYRARCMHDLNMFHKELIQPTPDFTVDLLLDASSSRVNDQESIAVQAYMITKSMQKLGIPVQVTCFRSMRRYTIMQKMLGYSSCEGTQGEDADALFWFYAAGSNRDGLAFRALEPYLADGTRATQQHVRKRILLVLTDAIPADTTKAVTENAGPLKVRDYDGALAVEDTRDAVRALRREGIYTAAIFWGVRHSVEDLRRIYGDHFLRIHEIAQLPDAVTKLLLRAILSIRDSQELT